jgi:Flp pilus assembly protein TadG
MGRTIRHAGDMLRLSRRNQRGASLVEFAIILPVFMVIVLGMFSGGVAYNRQIALRNAAREGARYGSILPKTPETVSGATWAERIRANVVDRSEGELTASQICVALVDGASGSVVLGTTPNAYSTGGARCFDDGGADGKKRVQVSVNASANIEALVYSRGITLTSKSTARYEGT